MPLRSFARPGRAPGKSAERAPPDGLIARLARGRWVSPLVVAAATAALAAALLPAVVNGDGLGYLKAAPTGIVVPGHLGYLPLLRALGRLAGHSDSLGLLGPARALSVASLVLAAALLHATARRLLGEAAGLLAGLGLAASFGAVQAGSDVETYAPALAALCLVLHAGLRRRDGGGWPWLVATILAVAAATLLHIENVLVAPAAALLCAAPSPDAAVRRWRLSSGALLLAGSGAVVAAAYLGAFRARGDDLTSAVHWVANASHGFSYPLRLTTPLVAVYGMAKTLVYAPYPYQASWPQVIAQATLGVALLGVMTALALRRGRRGTLGGAVAVAWVLPYAVVGVAFFASDNERWIFLLPPAWLVVAAGAASSSRALRVGAALLVVLVLADLGLGLPLARATWIRDRAAALDGAIAEGDLVISPGHSWDEYLGFYSGRVLDRFPMIYFCGLLGGAEPMKRELARRVDDARARGARVFLARIDEDAWDDGWKELVQFGVTPANVGTFLPPGPRVPVATGLFLLEKQP